MIDMDNETANDFPLRWSHVRDNTLAADSILLAVTWFDADDQRCESQLLADNVFGDYEFRTVEGETPDDLTLDAIRADLLRHERGESCLYRRLEYAFAAANRMMRDLAQQNRALRDHGTQGAP